MCRAHAEVIGGQDPGAFRVWSQRGRLYLAGEFDLAGVPEVEIAVFPVEGNLTVDCSGLTFIDCAALRVLMRAHKECSAAGFRFVLADPAPCLVRLLQLTGHDFFFDIHNSIHRSDGRP